MRTKRCYTDSSVQYSKSRRPKVSADPNNGSLHIVGYHGPVRKCRLKHVVNRVISESTVNAVTNRLSGVKLCDGGDHPDPRVDDIVTFLQKDKVYGIKGLPTGRSLTYHKLQRQHRKPLLSQEVECVETIPEGWTNTAPSLCSVVSAEDSREWSAQRGTIKAEVGANQSFYCWTSAETMSKQAVYIFGVEDNATWRYVTAVGKQLKLHKHKLEPSKIDLEKRMEEVDPRCFYLKSDELTGRRGYVMVPTTAKNMAVTISKSGRVNLSGLDRFTTKWEIKLS